MENLNSWGRLGEQHVDLILLLIPTVRKGIWEIGVDLNGLKLGWILACNEVGNEYSGAIKYGEFFW